MTPGARIQSAIEIISQVASVKAPADAVIGRYFSSHRFMGSKDRAAVAGFVFTVLRHEGPLLWWVEQLDMAPDARVLALAALVLHMQFNQEEISLLFDGSRFAPPRLTETEADFIAQLAGKTSNDAVLPRWAQLNVPEWLLPYLEESFGNHLEPELAALNAEASTDLRVNTLKCTREEAIARLKEEGIEASPTLFSPLGLRLNGRPPVASTRLFREGGVELQDEGSQLIAIMVGAKPGHKVIDFCAGAGGKTLALAASMNNKGRILAWDVSEKRLSRMSERLRRAGVDNVQKHTIENEHAAFLKRHKKSADRVLLDVPCSGTGTWRRNPDLKWRFLSENLNHLLPLQRSILQSASRLVKEGGRLVYATCSLLREENEHQVTWFLETHPDFVQIDASSLLPEAVTRGECSFLKITPQSHGTDGYFAAAFERKKGHSGDEELNEI